jgi:fatty-acyl-CoA synthase
MTAEPTTECAALVARASGSSVASLFVSQARQWPNRIAIQDGQRKVSYGELLDRVKRLSGVLVASAVGRGSRIAILSENRAEYLEVFLAAASVGAIVACQNWRLSSAELSHCLHLVEPQLCFVSERHAERLKGATATPGSDTLEFGEGYERALSMAEPRDGDADVTPEDALLILYTSGTTGLPKGAVISHRAEIARNLVIRAEFGLAPTDVFVAWSPLYHMGATDPALGTLMAGGKVITVDGFDSERLLDLVETETLGWFLLMPGMIGAFADQLERRGSKPKGVKLCGVMADLVSRAELARITRLLNAPYANTFGATETGCPPCSSSLIPIGVAPVGLPKQLSPFCEVKLVDAEDKEVTRGAPGQLCIRGPTLFSGYFRANDVNREEFRGGWFHMGDVFRQNADGSLDFVDRVKYLIKSGGENIYPAELERVLLQDARVLDAAVVRRPDARWGEVPVAFVARRDASLTEQALGDLCREQLAGYKQPKAVFFIPIEEFPRSASGKIQRHELEKRLQTLALEPIRRA